MSPILLLTCEHAGNDVPDEYKSLFTGADSILHSHCGWDPGAWKVARFLADELKVPLFGCFTTRLLIEANRSIHHHQLYSEYSANLSAEERQKLVSNIYKPYREQVEKEIELSKKPLIHLSIHSFTPIWENKERTTDIGLLFDPFRTMESEVCEKLRAHLHNNLTEHTVDFNEPYKGTDDGFTTHLRQLYSDNEYAGIEIEINQKYEATLAPIQEALLKAIKNLL